MNPEPVGLIDSHVHLQDEAFASDRARVLQRAAAAGVRWMVCNGTCEADWPAVLELARGHSGIVPCFGLHPWYVRQRSDQWLERLEHYLGAIPSGVGEVGLDRWIADRDETAQEQVFLAQLELARSLRHPVMIHCLRAWDWLMTVLRRATPLPASMMIHAYGGPVDLIQPLADMGAYFSFAGTVLDESKVRTRLAICQVPRDRLLIETDAPDLLPPAPFRQPKTAATAGREVNEPANLPAILGGIARLIGETEPRLRATLWDNGRRFLGGLAP